MSGVTNRTGAESGIIGTTESAPGMESDIIGGTKRTYSGYESRTFLGSGSIYFPEDKTVDWFLVGGGGGGSDGYSSNGNGGGGAGGVVQAVGYAISAGSYNISIGEGSSGYNTSAIPNPPTSSGGSGLGMRGQPSVFGTFIAHGGGGGSSTWLRQGTPPGSEGGCAGGGTLDGAHYNNTTTQGTYGSTPNVTGYGYTGGSAGQHWGGGGGGGAGGTGSHGSNSQYGHGGVGRTNVYETGSTKYFAGGGGGCGNSSEPGGAGSYGGGRGHGHCQYHNYNDYANGSYADAQFGHSGAVNSNQGSSHLNAFPHTGGGGGAQSYWSRWPSPGWQGSAGQGGSGYFVIRWAV